MKTSLELRGECLCLPEIVFRLKQQILRFVRNLLGQRSPILNRFYIPRN